MLYQYIRHWILSEVYLIHTINISGADCALLKVTILLTTVRIEIVSVLQYYCLSPVKRLHLNLAATVVYFWTLSFIALEMKGNKLFTTLLEFFLTRYRFIYTLLDSGQIIFPYHELCFIYILFIHQQMHFLLNLEKFKFTWKYT